MTMPDETPNEQALDGEASSVAVLADEGKAREKLLLDRLAHTGREAAEAKRLLAAQAREIGELRESLGNLNASLTREQEQKLQAELAALPPAERALKEIEILKQRRDARPRPAARQVETDDEYTARRTQEILAEVNGQFALDEDEALTGLESGLDASSEQAFIRSARKIARKRMLGQSEETAVPKKEEKKELLDTKAAQAEASQVRDDVLAQVRRELGLSAPATPRPAGGRSGGISSDDYNRTLKDANTSTQGTRSAIKALKEQIKAAEKASR